MASTIRDGRDRQAANWRAAGLRYYAHGAYLHWRFGCRVHRVSIDGGFTCPNVDGTVTTGGCVFCDNRSFSPSRRLPREKVTDQINAGIRRLQARYGCDRFLAYFQPGTNTYAPVDRLRQLFEEAAAHPQIVGLSIGTRPDCVPEEVLCLLEDLAERTYLSVEYGLQTIHNRSLDWMNRGHDYDALKDAVQRSRGRGFDICTHVILGLPGESWDDMMATAHEVSRLDVNAVKIHNLYAVKNTPLAKQVADGSVRLLDREEYVHLAADFLERLPMRCVIERVMGDAPAEYLVGPAWCLDRSRVRSAIAAELERRGTWQGSRCGESQSAALR